MVLLDLLNSIKDVCYLYHDLKLAKKHLRWSQTQLSCQHLILKPMDPYCEFGIQLLLWDFRLPSFFNSVSTSCIPETRLSYPKYIEDWYDMMIGSCDGILCFNTGSIYHDSVLVWNPSIRKFKILPHLDNPWDKRVNKTVYGFGYDNLIENYKLVAVCCNQRVCKTIVKVHALGTNSWRRIQDFPSGLPNESGKFVSGTINWLVSMVQRSSWVIVSLDIGKEAYQELLQPDYGGVYGCIPLGVLRDCLCILSNTRIFFLMFGLQRITEIKSFGLNCLPFNKRKTLSMGCHCQCALYFRG